MFKKNKKRLSIAEKRAGKEAMRKKKNYEPIGIEVLLFGERDLIHTSSDWIDNAPPSDNGVKDYDVWT